MYMSCDVDVRTVDRKTLKNIADVKLNMNLTKEEKIRDFIQQIDNPYCYIDNDLVVKLTFPDTEITLQDRLSSYVCTFDE